MRPHLVIDALVVQVPFCSEYFPNNQQHIHWDYTILLMEPRKIIHNQG